MEEQYDILSYQSTKSESYLLDPLDPLRTVVEFVLQHIVVTGYYRDIVLYALLIWTFLEVLFYVVVHVSLLPKLQPQVKPLPYNVGRIELLNKLLGEINRLQSYSLETFIRLYFLEADLKDIRVGNVRSFLAWVLFGIQEEQLSDDDKKIITEGYEIVCKEFNVSFEPGYNPKVKHVCITWDAVTHIHRPLFFYVGSYLLDAVITLFMFRLQGYRQYTIQGINYWFHPGSREGQHLQPVIFFHGITPGWAAYIPIVRSVSHGRPVFLVELNGIKVKSLEFSMPTPESFARATKLMMKRHHYQTASLVGHSFGSVTCAWFLKYNPEMVTHVTLIDPVSLLLFLPDVAYGFLYRKPRTLVEWVIYAFAASEVTISYSLRRNFYWYRSMLLLDEVPAHVGVLVSLAGGDEISCTAAIHEYVSNFQTSRKCDKSVKSAPVEVMVRHGHSHAQILVDIPAQRALVKALNFNEKQSINLESSVLH